MVRIGTIAALLVVGVSLFMAAGYVNARSDSDKTVVLKGIPHVLQNPDFCGEACAAMVLQKYGRGLDQDYVFNQSGLDPLSGRGCYTKELAKSLGRIGFDIGSVWYRVSPKQAKTGLEKQWWILHEDLVTGTPSIVCMHYDATPKAPEHFRLIVGYDGERDEVIYHEPAEKRGAYRRMKRLEFIKLWPLKYETDEWLVVRMPLLPKRNMSEIIPPASVGHTDADYAQHIMKLKKKLPGDRFTIILQRPFVVIGDESPSMVKRRAEGTVKWAVDLLKKSYFEKDPNEILDIWLFRDKQSYEENAGKIFRCKPHTPYGYFSHTDRALVMNIATGGGTLVHEIVHPFVASNFPECPAWFNEGLGSLYEQSSEKGGKIRGLTNWRLAGLQAAIRAEKVPSFKTLTSTSTHEFYEEDPGTNYAQARYLCYYLQEHDLLEKFYHSFYAKRKTDPTGYETLKEILGRRDMAKFKRDWESYVLELRFP
ncbi:MAG: C39 family peptidase [Pirellulales bacterium]|nr:C39 family peptidase [Pirellulales bacterium]